MAWNPSIPYNHSGNANLHSSYFPSSMEGLRFVLVKLDNKSLHIWKHRWTAFRSRSVPGNTGMFPGSAQQNCPNGSGWDAMYVAQNVGGNCNVPQRCGCETNGAGAPLYTWPCNGCNTYSSACIPWAGSTNISGTGSVDMPTTGFLTMPECLSGREIGQSDSTVFTDYQFIARPVKAGLTCNATGGGSWAYSVDYTSTADILTGSSPWFIKPGSSTMVAPAGKGPYNDSAWYHGLIGSAYSLPSMSGGIYATPSATMRWCNKSVYATGGITVQDITDQSTIFTSTGIRPDDAGTAVLSSQIESNSCLGSNLIYDGTGAEFWAGTARTMFGCTSYYALILLPTDAATAADPLGAGSLFADLHCTLHFDMDSHAIQKIFGAGHHLNNYPGTGQFGIPFNDGQDTGMQVGLALSGGMNPIYGYGDIANMAYSNTGLMHNLSNDWSWTGAPNITVDTVNGVDNNYPPTFPYTMNTGLEPTQMVVGGILDGEFVPLDDPWWDNGAGSNNNPWDIQIFNDIQKHLITEACFHRYDPNLTPTTYANKQKCIWITKTPASATWFDTINDYNFNNGTQYEVNCADHPFFSLHITHKVANDTVEFKNVATGWQDWGKEDMQGSIYGAGLENVKEMQGMTIAAQLVEDWSDPVSCPTVQDMPVLVTQTAGFDSMLADTNPSPNNTNIDNSTMTSGDCRGAFFMFDARIYGTNSNGESDYRKFNIWQTNACANSTTWAVHTGMTHSVNKHFYSVLGGFSSTTYGMHQGYGGATFTDQNYAVLYLGAYGVYEANTLTSQSFNTANTTNTVNFNLMDRSLNEGIATSLYCNIVTGEREWPDYVTNQNTPGHDPSWDPQGGAKFLHTHHATTSKNNWALRTGNGMVYNSNIASACPVGQAQLIIPAMCGAADGVLIVYAGSSTIPWTSATVNVYDNGGVLIASDTIGSATTWTTLISVPIGTGYTWDLVIPGCPTFTGLAFDIISDPTLAFNFEPMTPINPSTCTSLDGFLLGAFSASNISGITVPNNDHLTWVLYQDTSGLGTYNPADMVYVTHDHPFLSVANGGNISSNYPNGLTGSGNLGNGCAGISAPGSSCSNVEFAVADNLDDGCYRLVLCQNIEIDLTPTFPQPDSLTYIEFFDTTLTTNGPWMDCAIFYDFCLTCGPSGSCSCSVNVQPACSEFDDEDHGNGGTWPALTNGYVGGAAPWQPTDVGQVSVVMTGGVSPFTYSWTDAGGNVVSTTGPTATTNNQVSGLPPGTYTCTVTDANGDTFTDSATLIAPNPMTWTTNSTVIQPTCNNNNGEISGAVADPGSCGGAVQYALSLNSSATWDTIMTDEWVVESHTVPMTPASWQASSTFSNLPPGTYYLWARSTCWCAIPSGVITINAGTALTATIASSGALCTATLATLTVTATGTAPYSYVWTTGPLADPNFVAPATTSAVYTQNTLGIYDYTCDVTDANGCTAQVTIQTATANALVLTDVVSQIGCSGGTGSIVVTVSGGTANYTFVWTGGLSVTDGPAATTSYTKSGLAAGTYNLTVTDANGCTISGTYVIAPVTGLEAFIDLNHYEYNTVYGLPQTGTAYEDAWYGKYGGPTCPSAQCASSPCDDGTIRLILDSTSVVAGAAFPYDVEISNDGGATYWPVRNNAGTAYTGANGLTVTDGYDPGTGFLLSTGVAYDHITDGMVAGTYFELQGGTGGDEWNPGGGWVDLPFTEGSTWDIRLTETGTSCYIYVTTTILPSDYQNVDVGTNVATIVGHPSCCGCSSFGASIGTNVCDGALDITPTLGTYEDHTNVTYTYLWTYTHLPTTCALAGHINVNTQWVNQTTQDISAEWPGTYTVVVTDSCLGTDTDTYDLLDPIVYIDDITWTHPLCADCCDGTITVTAHGGSGNLEVSTDNRATWQPMTSNPYTITGLCDGIHNVWVRDDSFCGSEYFADPDDSVYGASFDEHCFADADITGVLTTSGTWTPTSNVSFIPTPVGAAFTGTGFTRIQLTAVSNFTAANACITNHNVFPGGTDGEITLNLVGGNAPYTITVQTLLGPVFVPGGPPMIPCAGIGPLSVQPDPCTLTGLPIPNSNLAATSVMTVTEMAGPITTNFNSHPVTGFVTNDTFFTFEQVSVSRDLGPSALGAEYLFYVQDNTGCVQIAQVGMDNGMFNLVSIYGAENCDCICPLGFTLDTDPASPTFEQCVSNIFDAVCFNGTHGYWDLCSNQYTGGIVPAAWGALGGALYGPWIAGAVNYGLAISIPSTTLPLKKDIAVITPNLLYDDNTGTPILGVDLAAWSTVLTTSYINNRLQDNAIWMTQTTWPTSPPPPPIPTQCWIGCITDVNFPAPVDSIICMASNEKMRMKIDGLTHIEMDGDDTIPATTASNEGHYNMFPVILPQGIHTISFEVYNTNGDGFMAFDIMASTMSSGNLFVAECLANGYTQAFHEANIILDAAFNKLSSQYWGQSGEEIQLGEATCGIGYSCCQTTTTIDQTPYCDALEADWIAQGSNVYSPTDLYYPGQVVLYTDPAYGVSNYYIASANSGSLFVPPANAGNPQLYPTPVAPNVCCYGGPPCVCTGATGYWEACAYNVQTAPNSGSTPSISGGNMYCVSDVTAPCEVPLDCGYCVDVNGVPAPQWIEKGPCESADDGALPVPALLGNEWITDASALSDLVECPAALANIAYSKIQGGLATDVMDIRCAWLVIMIKHMLRNLNICFTLEDVQDVFAGFLDHVCPTCKVKKALTPAEMAAITNMFTINNNLTFDF